MSHARQNHNEPEKDQFEPASSSLEQPRRNRILELLGFVESDGIDHRTPEQIAEDIRERPEDEAARRDRL
jgi:hypothetical protein